MLVTVLVDLLCAHRQVHECVCVCVCANHIVRLHDGGQ